MDRSIDSCQLHLKLYDSVLLAGYKCGEASVSACLGKYTVGILSMDDAVRVLSKHRFRAENYSRSCSDPANFIAIFPTLIELPAHNISLKAGRRIKPREHCPAIVYPRQVLILESYSPRVPLHPLQLQLTIQL